MMQARMSQQSDKMYSPDRDIAHCFAELVRITCARVADKSWSELNEVDRHTSDKDIAEAMKALAAFAVNDSPSPDMETVLSESGWFGLSVRAREHVLAHLGIVVMCYYYAGVRTATINGIGPHIADVDLPFVATAAADRLCNSTRIGRVMATAKTRLRKAWNAITGKTTTSHLDNVYGQISYRDVLLKYNDVLAALNKRFDPKPGNQDTGEGVRITHM